MESDKLIMHMIDISTMALKTIQCSSDHAYAKELMATIRHNINNMWAIIENNKNLCLGLGGSIESLLATYYEVLDTHFEGKEVIA